MSPIENRKNKFMLIIVSIVVVLIILSFALFSKKSDSSSPEETLLTYYFLINEGNYNEAFNLTIMNVEGESDIFFSEFEEFIMGNEENITTQINYTLYKKDMDDRTKDFVEEEINVIKLVFNPIWDCELNVEDYCIIYYDKFYNEFQEGPSYFSSELCLKINSCWYLTSFLLDIELLRPTTPFGMWNDFYAIGYTEGYLEFGMFSAIISPTDIRILVTVNGTDGGHMIIPNTIGVVKQNITWVNAPTGAEATYTDYTLSGEINYGDFITLTSLEPGTTYSFEVVYIPTDTIIDMFTTAHFTTS